MNERGVRAEVEDLVRLEPLVNEKSAIGDQAAGEVLEQQDGATPHRPASAPDPSERRLLAQGELALTRGRLHEARAVLAEWERRFPPERARRGVELARLLAPRSPPRPSGSPSMQRQGAGVRAGA
jgi:hypothetical protein